MSLKSMAFDQAGCFDEEDSLGVKLYMARLRIYQHHSERDTRFRGAVPGERGACLVSRE